MRITGAKVILTNPGRNYVTLKIETDEGIYGVGDATLFGRELTVAEDLRQHVIPLLIGRDPDLIEDTWQLLYRSPYWRRGPITMTSIAAVDMALWDIKGKALGVPVHSLLGGRVRKGITTYSHVSAASAEDAAEMVLAKTEAGYRAVRVQIAVPGIDDMYGVPSARERSREEYLGPVPFVEENFAPEPYLRFIPGALAAVRERVGPEVMLAHDAHHRLTPSQAGWLGRRLEDLQLMWLEDVVPAELQSSFRQIRAATTTPLAVGEVFNSIYDSELLVREQLVDYIRSTVVHAGGITGLRKIAAHAEPYLVRTGCHGAFDLSPVTMAAAVHYDVATHNAAIQEYMGFAPEASEVFAWRWSFDDGFLNVSDDPGLGVDIDEDAAARFPFQRSYLPVSRRVDGGVSNW